MTTSDIREAQEGDRIAFPLTIDTDTGVAVIGGVIIGVKNGCTVIFDIVVMDPNHADMFPDHWLGMSFPRYTEPVPEHTHEEEVGETVPGGSG